MSKTCSVAGHDLCEIKARWDGTVRARQMDFNLIDCSHLNIKPVMEGSREKK